MPGVFLCGTLARVIHPTYLEQDMNDKTGYATQTTGDWLETVGGFTNVGVEV